MLPSTLTDLRDNTSTTKIRPISPIYWHQVQLTTIDLFQNQYLNHTDRVSWYKLYFSYQLDKSSRFLQLYYTTSSWDCPCHGPCHICICRILQNTCWVQPVRGNCKDDKPQFGSFEPLRRSMKPGGLAAAAIKAEKSMWRTMLWMQSATIFQILS